MPRLTRTALVAGAVAVALAATGGGVALATGGSDTDRDTPITGAALERASQAALAEVGEGRVTETETGDEESFYEVEITLADGSQVDVQLDEQFRVVGSEVDEEDDEDDDELDY